MTLLSGLTAVPLLGARAGRAQIESLVPVVDKVTGGAPLKPGRVKLNVPQLADNGHSVPLKVTVDSPMLDSDYVRSIHILSEKNPRPVIATFYFVPNVDRAEVATRVRLNGTQRLLAIAAMSDGTYWSATTEVVVTESACLDGS